MRLLEHVPVEPAPAHLQLRLRARDHQRGPGHLRARRLLDHRRVRPPPCPPQLGLHRRAPQRAASGSAGSCPTTRPSSPRSRCCRSPPYERTPGAGPHRRPGRSPLQRRGAGDPRLHGRGRLTAGPRTGRAHGRRPGGDLAGRLRSRRLRRAARRAVPGHARARGLQRGGRHAAAHLPPGTAQEPTAHRGPDRAAPRDPRGADRRPDRHLRAAPDGDHPPAQPHVGRPGAAVAPLLGEPRAGPRRTRAARAGRTRSAPRADRDGPVVPRCRPAVLQTDARDDRRSLARRDPAARHRLLHHALRDHGAHADVARRLPGAGPAPQLRLPAQDPPGAPVAAWRDAVGPQVPPAPRAVPRPGRDLPRRHLRGHPPRPGVGHDVDGDDARLLGPAEPRPRRPRGHRPLLGGPARAHAAPLRRGARRPAGRPDHRRALRRVHGGRHGHGGTGLRSGRPATRRSLPGRHGGVHGRAPSGQVRRRRVRPGRVRLGPPRAPEGTLVLHRALRRDAPNREPVPRSLPGRVSG